MIKKVNVTEQVVQYLKENIEAGNWEVGEKIPSENQMTLTLGVSRSSVRTALQYMIGIGVLESIHGKGTFLINSQVENWEEADNKITSEDCQNIAKVLEFRRILEPDACRLAVQHGGEQTVAELEKYLNQMKKYEGDRERFVNADLKFHEVICRASQNSLLEKSLHKVFLETKKNHSQMNELFGYHTGIQAHTQILQAFKEGDAQKAYEAMWNHMNQAMEKI